MRALVSLAVDLLASRRVSRNIQAIRASETLYKAGERSLSNDYKALTKDPNVDVVIQAMLTLNRWKVLDRSDGAVTAKEPVTRSPAS